jgi:hypothetical protein
MPNFLTAYCVFEQDYIFEMHILSVTFYMTAINAEYHLQVHLLSQMLPVPQKQVTNYKTVDLLGTDTTSIGLQ